MFWLVLLCLLCMNRFLNDRENDRELLFDIDSLALTMSPLMKSHLGLEFSFFSLLSSKQTDKNKSSQLNSTKSVLRQTPMRLSMFARGARRFAMVFKMASMTIVRQAPW